MSDDISQKIYVMISVAEDQQKDAQQTLDRLKQETAELNKLKKALPPAIGNAIKQGVAESREGLDKSIEASSDKSIKRLEQATRDTLEASETLKQEMADFKFKALLYSIAFITAMFIMMMFIAWLKIPSLDEIRERKETIAMLNANGAEADVRRCDGKVCIRVIKSKCNYSPTRDYCIIDPK